MFQPLSSSSWRIWTQISSQKNGVQHLRLHWRWWDKRTCKTWEESMQTLNPHHRNPEEYDNMLLFNAWPSLIVWFLGGAFHSNCQTVIDWMVPKLYLGHPSFRKEGMFESLSLTEFGDWFSRSPSFFNKARKAVDVLRHLEKRFSDPPQNSMHAWHVGHDSFAAALLPFFKHGLGGECSSPPFQDCMHALTAMIKSQGHPTCFHGVIQVSWWVLSESWSWVRVIQNSYKFT